MKRTVRLSALCLLSTLLHHSGAEATWMQPQVGVRHIEGKGIGYRKGYTTLEGFFTLPFEFLTPIIDLRGHIFDDGYFAANAGLGARFGLSRTNGIYAYYDYRQSRHGHFNQISLGAESLGDVWDVRLNGYLPLGKKEGASYDKGTYFKDHHVMQQKKKDYAMKGFDGEIALHLIDHKQVSLDGAIGPYYLRDTKRGCWGVQSRLSSTIFRYLDVELLGSYDSLFKWIGQVSLGISIPLGPFEPGTVRKKAPPVRHEIIPLDSVHERHVAINPQTNLPFTLWFVDNTSPRSLGSFDAPFTTLAQAQRYSNPYDIIYVFEGDGSSRGLDTGLMLKNHQSLISSSQPLTLSTNKGSIEMPALTQGSPLLSHPEDDILHLAQGNSISGFRFGSCMNAIHGKEVRDIEIFHNVFDSSFSNSMIDLSDVQGEVTIAHNAFITPDTEGHCNAITIENQQGSGTIAISDNIFQDHNGDAIKIALRKEAHFGLAIERNELIASRKENVSFFSSLPNGIVIEAHDQSQGIVAIKENACYYHDIFGISVTASDTAELRTEIEKNTIEAGTAFASFNDPSIGICIKTSDAAIQHATVIENEVSQAKTFGICFATDSSSETSVQIIGNSIQAGEPSHIHGLSSGIATLMQGSGPMKSGISDNILKEWQGQGGFLAMNMSTAGETTGQMTLDLLRNQCDTFYTLYNENYLNGGIIAVKPGLETNIGEIRTNPLPPDVPPVFKAPGPIFYLPPEGSTPGASE